MSNKKYKKYQKKISNYEFKFNICNEVNKNELEKFYKKFNIYKITTKILYKYPNYYSDIKFIDLGQPSNINEYIFNDIIWTHEHFEYIEEIRSIEYDIQILLFESYELGLISSIQFELAKKIYNLVCKIFELDIIVRDFFNVDINSNNNDENNLTFYQLEFYFNLIEIIILKMHYIEKKSDKKYNKIELLLDNSKYLNNIFKLKKSLEKIYLCSNI